MRLSEIYTSVQGEGPGNGLMTQFIRFAGCNLKCPGWPCDTQHAIDPAYRSEWKKMSPDEVVAHVQPYPKRVVFTGGEPHLQRNTELMQLARMLLNDGYTIEVFSNGALAFPEWVCAHGVRTIMDWKLPGSGEDPYVQERIDNLSMLGAKDAVKFVIADRNDFDLAVDLWHEHIFLPGRQVHTYYGVAWGKMENAELIEWVADSKLDWKLNLQVHNYIWDRDERAR